jgi:hypothetical protein
VYIPYSRIDPFFLERPRPFFNTTVTSVEGRSVRILLPHGEESDLIGTSLVHTNIGILIIQIGDFHSETTLLNPLSKNLLQFCRLLLGDDDHVHFDKCRTITEFRYIIQNNINSYKYVVLIGHGSNNCLIFGSADRINAHIVKQIFTTASQSPKSLISLCCQTGHRDFAKIVSASEMIESFIAPFHNVHGVIASHFMQTYFANHLLKGMIDKTAFNRSVKALATRTIFRFWEKGKLK